MEAAPSFEALRALRTRADNLPTSLELMGPDEGLALASLLASAVHNECDKLAAAAAELAADRAAAEAAAAAHYRLALAAKKLLGPMEEASKAWGLSGKAGARAAEVLADIKARVCARASYGAEGEERAACDAWGRMQIFTHTIFFFI